jgi:hypothetical protein
MRRSLRSGKASPDGFPFSQVETLPPASQPNSFAKLGTCQSLTELLSSSRTMGQDASTPRNQPSILCSPQTCFPASQVMTLPSASQPSCLAKLGMRQSLFKLLYQVEQWSKMRRSLGTSQASSAVSRRVFLLFKSWRCHPRAN